MATLAPSETMLVFIDAVRAKMEADGVSYSELARRTGIAQPKIHITLNGKCGSCTLATADKIAAGLGSTTLDLLNSVKKSRR